MIWPMVVTTVITGNLAIGVVVDIALGAMAEPSWRKLAFFSKIGKLVAVDHKRSDSGQ